MGRVRNVIANVFVHFDWGEAIRCACAVGALIAFFMGLLLAILRLNVSWCWLWTISGILCTVLAGLHDA